MALKTIRVRIKSVDEALDNAIGAMRAIQSKRRVRKRVGEYFESLDAVRAALTEKRITLLRLVRERAPASEALRELGLITIAEKRRGVPSRLRSRTTEIVLRIAV